METRVNFNLHGIEIISHLILLKTFTSYPYRYVYIQQYNFVTSNYVQLMCEQTFSRMSVHTGYSSLSRRMDTSQQAAAWCLLP